jgi:hypothetical protein
MSIQVFGVELRKIGNVKELYDDVDRVLGKKEITYRNVSSETSLQAIGHSLHKMMKVDGHFSVCTIKECALIANIVIPVERLNIYNAIHCVNWSDMLPDFTTKVIAMVLDDFRSILNRQE